MARLSTGYTEEQLKAMRDWVADYYSHYRVFDVDYLNDREVISEVKSHYDGGIEQFIIDGGCSKKDILSNLESYLAFCVGDQDIYHQ